LKEPEGYRVDAPQQCANCDTFLLKVCNFTNHEKSTVRSISIKFQYQAKQDLISISKKISDDIPCDRGIAIPQSLAFFWPFNNRLGFFLYSF